jgi:hypothetical protein
MFIKWTFIFPRCITEYKLVSLILFRNVQIISILHSLWSRVTNHKRITRTYTLTCAIRAPGTLIQRCWRSYTLVKKMKSDKPLSFNDLQVAINATTTTVRGLWILNLIFLTDNLNPDLQTWFSVIRVWRQLLISPREDKAKLGRKGYSAQARKVGLDNRIKTFRKVKRCLPFSLSSFLLSFVVWSLPPNHCSCRGLMFNLN